MRREMVALINAVKTILPQADHERLHQLFQRNLGGESFAIGELEIVAEVIDE